MENIVILSTVVKMIENNDRCPLIRIRARCSQEVYTQEIQVIFLHATKQYEKVITIMKIVLIFKGMVSYGSSLPASVRSSQGKMIHSLVVHTHMP